MMLVNWKAQSGVVRNLREGQTEEGTEPLLHNRDIPASRICHL
jgi:hypothetical protein